MFVIGDANQSCAQMSEADSKPSSHSCQPLSDTEISTGLISLSARDYALPKTLLRRGFSVSEDGQNLLFQSDKKESFVVMRYVEVLFVSMLPDDEDPIIHCRLTNGKLFHFNETLLADPRGLTKLLLEKNVQIENNSQTAMRVQIYFREQSNSATRVPRSEDYGWSHDNKFFGMPHGYVAKKKGSLYCYGREFSYELPPIKPHALKAWQDDIAHYALSNARGVLAFGAAFSAPLMKLLNNHTGFGLHFYGSSSTGKSLLLRMTNTIFGSGREMKLRTWNSTRSFIDTQVMMCNDRPILFDDISDQLDPKAIFETMYGIPAGCSRGRCTSTGDPKEVLEWRTILLSTGEQSVPQYLKDRGLRINAGQLVRVLNIPCNDTYGSIDTIPFWMDNAHDAAINIEQYIGREEYYGIAGQAFIESIARTSTPEKLAKDFKEFFDLVDKWIVRARSPQQRRVLRNIALMLFSLKLAYEYWIIGTHPKELMNENLRLVIMTVLDSLGEHSYEIESFLSRFSGTVRKYLHQRFRDIFDTGFRGIVWGWRDDDYVYLLPSTFRNEMCEGVDPAQASKALVEREILVPSKDSLTTRMRVDGKQVRVMKLNLERL